MSLREDMDALERHLRKGDAEAYLRGEAKIIPRDGLPPDDTAGKYFSSDYAWISKRGD